MQTKKRAKPVKFEGKKSVPAKPLPPEDAVEEVAAPPSVKSEDLSPHEHSGIEAHFSSTVQTLDIEIPDSRRVDASDAQEVEKQEEIVTTPTSVPEVHTEEKPISETEENIPESTKQDESGEEEQAVKNEDSPDSEEQEGDSSELTKQTESEQSEDSNDSAEDSPSVTEQDGAFFNRPPDEYDKKKNNRLYFFIVFFITFLVGLAFFGGIYYTNFKKGENDANSKKNAEMAESPTPTQKPVDLTKYTIKVLNGTSVAGVAAKVKADLTTAGFKPEAVGNATTPDFTTTEIAAKKSVDKAYLTQLKEFLGKTYAVGDVTELANGESDVVVTIGTTSAK